MAQDEHPSSAVTRTDRGCFRNESLIVQVARATFHNERGGRKKRRRSGGDRERERSVKIKFAAWLDLRILGVVIKCSEHVGLAWPFGAVK